MTSVQRIKNFGNCHFGSTFGDSEGLRVTNDFLKTLAKNVFQQSLRYYKNQKELPFVHREKQLHSVFCPAISKITDSFLMEAPVKRKANIEEDGKNESHGWVDYWCEYRGFTYFIEIKHGYYSTHSGKLRGDCLVKWEDANNQLNNVKKEIKDWITDKGAFRISLLFMPFYETNNKTRLIEKLKEHNNFIKDTLSYSKSTKVNWNCLCELHDSIVGPHEYRNSKEYHPAVGIYCNVFELQK